MPSSDAEKAQPILKNSGCSTSQPQGHRSLSRTTGGKPSRKFCMNRAPFAVVVTTLAASKSKGRPYSRKFERTEILLSSPIFNFAGMGVLECGRNRAGFSPTFSCGCLGDHVNFRHLERARIQLSPRVRRSRRGDELPRRRRAMHWTESRNSLKPWAFRRSQACAALCLA